MKSNEPFALNCRVVEAVTILNFQQGTILLLEETIGSIEEDSCLNDLQVQVLEPELALSIAKRRIFV